MKEIIPVVTSFLIGAMITLIIISRHPCTQIESNCKITPDYKLITDGKIIDTIWIYKIKINQKKSK